jgi:hypothetical protein
MYVDLVTLVEGLRGRFLLYVLHPGMKFRT